MIDFGNLPAQDKLYYLDKEAGQAIYCADCREILPELPKVDLSLTDPPYGIETGRIGIVGASKLAQVTDYGEQDWDYRTLTEEEVRMVLRAATKHIIFGGNYMANLLPASRCWLVWDKENGANAFADCELAWTNLDKAVRIYRYRWAGMLQGDMRHKEMRVHPTQKPVSLMKWCILQAGEGVQDIIDPFMGCGSTLFAGKQLNRQCIGIEEREKYCEIAAKRLAQSIMKLEEPAEARQAEERLRQFVYFDDLPPNP